MDHILNADQERYLWQNAAGFLIFFAAAILPNSCKDVQRFTWVNCPTEPTHFFTLILQAFLFAFKVLPEVLTGGKPTNASFFSVPKNFSFPRLASLFFALSGNKREAGEGPPPKPIQSRQRLSSPMKESEISERFCKCSPTARPRRGERKRHKRASVNVPPFVHIGKKGFLALIAVGGR